MTKALASGLLAAGLSLMTATAAEKSGDAVLYELRTYHAEPGKLDALLTRFRDHTCKLFEKHGMTNVGYWVPQDEPGHSNTLIYVIAHASREQAKKNWAAFGADPDWVKARTASEANGKIVEKVESVFMDATDYSKMK